MIIFFYSNTKYIVATRQCKEPIFAFSWPEWLSPQCNVIRTLPVLFKKWTFVSAVFTLSQSFCIGQMNSTLHYFRRLSRIQVIHTLLLFVAWLSEVGEFSVSHLVSESVAELYRTFACYTRNVSLRSGLISVDFLCIQIIRKAIEIEYLLWWSYDYRTWFFSWPRTSCCSKREWLIAFCSSLTHWGRGHLNCLNAHSRGLNNLNQLLYCVSLKICNKFANYFCELKFSGNTHQRP